jgi:hypothetical protein
MKSGTCIGAMAYTSINGMAAKGHRDASLFLLSKAPSVMLSRPVAGRPVPTDGDVLLGCSVAPGFEFCDFELLDHQAEAALMLMTVAPKLDYLVFNG